MARKLHTVLRSHRAVRHAEHLLLLLLMMKVLLQLLLFFLLSLVDLEGVHDAQGQRVGLVRHHLNVDYFEVGWPVAARNLVAQHL